MQDIFTIVYKFTDVATASRIRRINHRLSLLPLKTTVYHGLDDVYLYMVGNKLHRLDGPAKYNKLFSVWYREGVCHREYHMSVIYENGYGYAVDGLFHREVGPAMISKKDGNIQIWYIRGKCHRKTGPASCKLWLTNDKFHRLDGPAVVDTYFIQKSCHRINGPAVKSQWHVDNKRIR